MNGGAGETLDVVLMDPATASLSTDARVTNVNVLSDRNIEFDLEVDPGAVVRPLRTVFMKSRVNVNNGTSTLLNHETVEFNVVQP